MKWLETILHFILLLSEAKIFLNNLMQEKLTLNPKKVISSMVGIMSDRFLYSVPGKDRSE